MGIDLVRHPGCFWITGSFPMEFLYLSRKPVFGLQAYFDQHEHKWDFNQHILKRVAIS